MYKTLFLFLLTSVIFTSASLAQQADAGEDIYITAANNIVDLNANAPEFPNYGDWQIICSNGILFSISDPHSPFMADYGPNILVWIIYDEVLQTASSDTVIVFMYDVIPPVDCGSQAEYCAAPANHNLASYISPVGSVFWEVVSGSALIADPTSIDITVTDIGPGMTIIQETKTETCQTSYCFHTIYVPENSFANAGDDVVVFECLSDAIVLNGSTPMNGATGTWTQLSGASALMLSDIHDPHAAIMESFTGTVQLQWQIEDVGPCSGNVSSDVVELASYWEDPYMPDAGPDQYICQNSTQLVGTSNSFLGTDAYWSVVEGSGVFSNIGIYNPNVTGLSYGENIFRLNQPTICNGLLYSEVSIFVFDAPIINAGPDVSICAGESVQLGAMASPGNPLTISWSPALALSSSTILNPIASPPSNNVIYTITGDWGNGCVAIDQVVISVISVGPTWAGPDISICYGSETTQLTGSPSGGVWSGPAVTATGLFTPTSAGTFQIAYSTQNMFGCFSSDATTITVAVSGNGCPDIAGCTDPVACNYEMSAQFDDGSCSYPLPDQVDCFVLQDLLDLIANFGCIVMPDCEAYDLDGDGIVGISDLIILMGEL